MADVMRSDASAFEGRSRTGWLLVGFALGGFFDGILLHQILQWHHLLSGLDDPAGSNLPFQVLADGLFHLLMYVLAVIGMMLLLGAPRASRSAIISYVLIGFGVWHVLDAFVSHWVLGLHRIKMDSANPLVWDLAWFVAFGVVPLVIGLLMPKGGRPSLRSSAAVMSITLAAAATAAIGPRFYDAGETIIVFRPGMEEADMMGAVLAAEANLKWTDASGTIWAVDEVSWSGLVTLHAKGALLVSSTPIVAGCLAWTRSA
jgi:uncharacterized membrane protein